MSIESDAHQWRLHQAKELIESVLRDDGEPAYVEDPDKPGSYIPNPAPTRTVTDR